MIEKHTKELNKNTNMDKIFDDTEFVYTEITGEDGSKEIIGGGYKINNFFMQDGVPIMSTITTNKNIDIDENMNGGGNRVSTPFENLAVPAGLFYINTRIPKNTGTGTNHYTKHEQLPDDIYDKLFELVNGKKSNKSEKKTHKNLKTIKNKKRSRKNKFVS
jgi:hypothetical protein